MLPLGLLTAPLALGLAAAAAPPAGPGPQDTTTAPVATSAQTEPDAIAKDPKAKAKAKAKPKAKPKAGPTGLPRHRWVYDNLIALRYNPIGLLNRNRVGYRVQVVDKDTALFRDSYFAAKFYSYISPALARIGPMLEFQPLAILNLHAHYNFVGYYGNFENLQSFRTPTADFSDTRLDEGDERDENYATLGHMVTLSALLQAKVGPVAVRDNVQFYWQDMQLRNGDTVFFDQTIDVLAPDRGWTTTNDLDLLYLFDFGLTVGARYTLSHAFYRDSHFLPGESTDNPNGPTHRVGPAILYRFYDRPERLFNRPTIGLLTQWWVRHRYRTGEDTSVGLPYIALVFLFNGEGPIRRLR